MKLYKTHQFTTGFFTGNINAVKLAKVLNEAGGEGWTLRSHIHETRRMMLLFRREIHILIFERDLPDEFLDAGPAVSRHAVAAPRQ